MSAYIGQDGEVIQSGRKDSASGDALARYRAWEADPGACDDRTRLLVRLLATALEASTAPRRTGRDAR